MITPDLVLSATERWKRLPPPGLETLRARPGATPEEAKQRQDRMNRLARIASGEKARAMALGAGETPRAAALQNDVIRTIGFERVIGTRDLVNIDFLELAIAMARAVGRMHAGNEFGTGFLVGPRLLMTNHHVVEDEEGATDWLLELDYQQNSSGDLLPVQRYRMDPGYFFYTDENLDFTIAGVAQTSDKQRPLSSYPWVKLIGEIGKAQTGDPINIIQHPNGGLKQIAFRQNEIIAVSGEQPNFLCYSTDTEPGSSGSPCFNDQWELVALHHSGVGKPDGHGGVLKKDGQTWKEGDNPEDIQWIGNEGVRVSAIVKALQAVELKPEFRDLRDQMLAGDSPNPIELARAASGTDDGGAKNTAGSDSPVEIHASAEVDSGGGMPSNVVSFRVPLVVSVSFGDASAESPATAGADSAPGVSGSAGLEAVVIDQDWKARKGYDPKFLGVNVPLPKLTTAQLQDTAQVSPDFRNGGAPYTNYELCYWNYSVLMNKRYRTAWCSAANVDGDRRYDFGPRQGDRWFVDKRISASEQLGQEAFEHGIDRGHLTRLQDAAWGATKDTALKSSNDTFHFTNCSLQASPFNERKDRWQGLEQFLLEQHAKPEKRRIVVITGPVFNASDPKYKNDKMDYAVPCPLQFWKVCVLVKADDTVSATGFILGQQDISQLPGFEAFNVGAAQITLAQLEQKTGLDFGDLKAHDHFAQTGEVGALEKLVQGNKQRFLHSPREIVV